MDPETITVGVMNQIRVGQVMVQSNKDSTEELVIIIKELLKDELTKEYLKKNIPEYVE